MKSMQAVLEKQIKDMTEDELKNIFHRDYLRRLTRYRMTDDFYRKKYGMNLEGFEKEKEEILNKAKKIFGYS